MRSRSRYPFLAFLALATVLSSLGGGTARAAQPSSHTKDNGSLTVFAAASLTQAFTTIGTAFDKANNVTVKFNFAGSDSLVTQMSQGAPADVFASANQAQMTLATQKGLISTTSAPKVFAYNRLVLIVPKNNPAHIYSLPDIGRPGVNLVLAAPAVPVGKYARAAFAEWATNEAFGTDFVSRVMANVKSNETDVTAVTAKVSLGEADAGIVYVTDVTPQVASKVTTIAIPPALNQLAIYPIAVTKSSGNAVLARKFLDYVQSSAGKAVLAGQNFITNLPVSTPSTSITISGLVTTTTRLSVADLKKLPVLTDTVTLRTDAGRQGVYSYTGALLNTVVQKAIPLTNPSFKNDALRRFVTVGATDGYQVTIAMAEILPTFGNQKVLLAYAKNGKALGPDEGAVRLIVPSDSLAGRWVSNVNSIFVGAPVGTP
jgi:molybdate transport system substrate-binding protein